MSHHYLIPANAGIQFLYGLPAPDFAGVTALRDFLETLLDRRLGCADHNLPAQTGLTEAPLCSARNNAMHWF